MKFEKLNVGDSYGKKMFLYGILVSFFLIILISIFTSRAKYRLTESVKIVDSVVSYSPYDFKIMEIYKQKEGSNCTDVNTCYDKLSDTDRMPSDGYILNSDNSYCNLSDDSKDNEATLTSNESGETVISGLIVKDKCYLYYDRILTESEKTLAGLGKSESTEGCPVGSVGTQSTLNLICKAEDDFGESYYFRGRVNDNWVKFGKTGTNSSGSDIYWRIVRINGDGSIRMIYAGTGGPNSSDGGYVGNRNSQISTTYSWNDYYNTKNEYVGYEWKNNDMHGYGLSATKSTALQALNTWFEANLKDEWDSGNGKIDTNAGFCNDRSAGSNETTTWSDTMSTVDDVRANLYYGGYLRLKFSSMQPTLKCSTVVNRDKDFFTYTNASTGTKSLTYPVGLITADEAAFAGSGTSPSSNKLYYLYTGEYYWTMTPYRGYYSYAKLFFITSSGEVSIIRVSGDISTNPDVNYNMGIRPVINLKADTEFTGTGISTDPYVVKN